jgi:MFS family permease
VRAGWFCRLCNGDSRVATILLAYTVNSLGSGLWLTGGTIFLLRERALSGTEVGIGLTVGGVLGVAFGLLAGNVADRVGARRVVLAALVIEGAAMLAYLGVSNLVSLITVATVAAAGLSSTNTARGALLVQVFGVADATWIRSLTRAGSNLGIALGGLGAGVLLALANPAAYRALVIGDALTFIVAALLLIRLPNLGVQEDGEPLDSWRALKDARYVSLTVVNAVVTMQYGVLSVGVPMWISARGVVPDFMLAPLMVINTVICVLFQVRAGRGMEQPRRAGIAITRSGVLFFASCGLIALSGSFSGVEVATAVLIVAALAHSIGELLQAGGSFGASYAFAPDGHHGQYQGVWNVGYSLGESVSPLAMSLAINAGVPGWIALGSLLLAFTLIFQLLVTRAAA